MPRGPEDSSDSVCEAAGGSAALVRLAEAWHRRCLADPVVSHAFSHGDLHPRHVERLAAYWAESLGGPSVYTAEIEDHSHVLRMHAGNGAHEEMDRRAERCFAHALDDADIPRDPRLRSTLCDWFASMNEAMAEHPDSADDVPAGLAIPRWSWQGPAAAP